MQLSAPLNGVYLYINNANERLLLKNNDLNKQLMNFVSYGIQELIGSIANMTLLKDRGQTDFDTVMTSEMLYQMNMIHANFIILNISSEHWWTGSYIQKWVIRCFRWICNVKITCW